MSDLKVFESQTLSLAMKQRADEYRTLKDQLEQLKQAFVEIVQLDDFKGKTATAIKAFYQAQIDVVEAWERPELPSTNRSHKGEDLTDNYFGD
ncbi:T7SS effector LXG polymorphic toxin [Bacillus marasmi]|uniref:T7SS effector LXG polymorphic toxin n=1 Tax=Bacillus marasmi TaxID=1926279 RepID=UPI0011C83E4E|nr:T7SS effector LXG polymorphic toxin [Bacillus marasmi]